ATYWYVNTTSSAENGSPSAHLMPGLSLYVTVLPSAPRPPLSLLGTSAASTGAKVPSAPTVISGSVMNRAAMKSLVPWDRCELRMVGPCHISIRRGPPAPRPPDAAAAGLVVAAGAAGAVVGAAAAGLLVAPAAGGVVGAVAGAGAVVGALMAGAVDEQAASRDARTPPVRPKAVR